MRSIRILLPALLAGALLAGCGNASDEKADGGDNKPGGSSVTCTTQGVTDSKILMGGSIPQSGPLAVTSTINEGREAYFKMVNDRGGVNGRTIEWKTYDDQGAPDRVLSNVRRLVDQDKVFLVSGTVGTVQGLGAMDYTNSAGVPFLFPVSGSAAWSEPVQPLVYGFQPAYPNEARLFANHIADSFEGKKVGILGQADDAGDEWIDPFTDELAKRDIEPVAVERFDVTAQDVSANISNLQKAGAEVVATFSRVDILAKALGESRSRDYDATFIVSNIGFSNQLFTLVEGDVAEGTQASGYFATNDPDNAALAEHTEAMGSTKVDDFTMLGWSSASVIVKALEDAGKDLTCESFLSALQGMQGFDNGIAPPISFGPDDHQAIDSQYFLEVKGGQFEPITGLLDPSGKPID